MNKPSVTKIEAANRLNLLHNTSCRFGKYKSRKPGQMLVSLLRYAPFHDSRQKNSFFSNLANKKKYNTVSLTNQRPQR